MSDTVWIAEVQKGRYYESVRIGIFTDRAKAQEACQTLVDRWVIREEYNAVTLEWDYHGGAGWTADHGEDEDEYPHFWVGELTLNEVEWEVVHSHILDSTY